LFSVATARAAQSPVLALQHPDAHSASEAQLPVINWPPGAFPEGVPPAWRGIAPADTTGQSISYARGTE
jgi:hypothetical protein